MVRSEIGHTFRLVVPAMLLPPLWFDCSPWNESALPTCSIPLLNFPAYVLAASMLVLIFGGVVLWLPIVGIAYLVSTGYKYRAWKTGALRMWSVQFIIWAIATGLIGWLILSNVG